MKARESRTPAVQAKKESAFFGKKAEGAFFGSQQAADHFFPGQQAGGESIQTKLTVGQPNDVYEKEADSMADKVVRRMSEPGVQKCEACEKKEEVQRKPIFESEGEAKEGAVRRKPSSSSSTPAVSPSVESGLRSSKGSGSPLPNTTRQQMESSFGKDFSGVRVHDNGAARQMNKDLNSQAFAHGKDIYFNAGKYNPSSTEGQHLLAHELTHVVQQGGSSASSGSTAEGKPGANAMTASPAAHGPAPIAMKAETITEDKPRGMEAQFAGTPTSNDIQKDGAPTDPNQGGCTPPPSGPPYVDTKTGFQIDTGPNPKVITAPEITLPAIKDRNAPKFNTPLSFLAGRPKTDQINKWIAEVKKQKADDSAQAFLSKRKKTEDTGMYFLKSKSSNFSLFGTAEQIKQLSYIPKWDRHGAPRLHQVDHIVELQLGGKDVETNYELLDSKANNSSGAVVKGQIGKIVRAALKAFKDLCVPGLPTVDDVIQEDKATTRVNIQKVKDFSLKTLGDGKEGYWTIDEIEKGTQLEQMRDMDEGERKAIQGSKSRFILFLRENEGTPHPFDTPDGKAGPKKGWLPGIDLEGLVISNGDAADGEKMGAITIKLGSALAKSFKMDQAQPIEIPFTRMAGLINAGSLVLKDVAPKLAFLLRFIGLSPIKITNFDLLDNGILMTGYIEASVPMIKDSQIDFSVQGNDITLSKTFSVGEIKLFPDPPFKIDDVSLSIFASTEHGFGVRGDIDFSIKGLGKGTVSGIGDTNDGFGVLGKFTIDSPRFKGSSIGFKYLHEEWTIDGSIVIPENSGFKGIEKGKLDIHYDKGTVTANGNVTLTVPGIKSLILDATIKPDGSIFIHTTATLNSLPGIKDGGTVTLEVSKAAGGDDYSLAVSGEVEPNLPKIPKLSPRFTFSYKDGLFMAEGKSDFGTTGGLITGNVTVGVTNGVVVDGKLQEGSATGKKIAFYGKGDFKFTPLHDITLDLGVKIDTEGQALFSISIDETFKPFKNVEPKPTELIGAHLDIPVFGIPFLTLAVGIDFKTSWYLSWTPLTIGMKAGIKDKTYDDLINGNFSVPFALSLKTSGKVGLKVGVTLSAEAIVGVFVGGIGLGGYAKLEVDAEAEGKINANWNGEKGLQLKDGQGTAKADLNLIVGLDGRAFADLNLLVTRTNLWEHPYPGKELPPTKLGGIGITAPFEFDENNQLKPFDPARIQFDPPLDPATAKDYGHKVVDPDGMKKDSPVKDDDTVKKDISKIIDDKLRSAGKNQSVDRYSYINDLRNHMLDSTDPKLTKFVILAMDDALRQIESEDFDQFKNGILNSKDTKAAKFASIDRFQQQHTTVDHTLLDTLRSEVDSQPDPAPAPADNTSVSRKPADASPVGPVAPPAVQQGIDSTKGSGSPLPGSTREQMESSIGADLSGVKIHTDSAAGRMNKDLNAQAFTHGSDIYFDKGKYDPDSKEGQRLLAHELTHTLQQNGSDSSKEKTREKGLIQRSPGKNDVASDTFGDVTLNTWAGLGQIGISLYGEPWVQVRWDPDYHVLPIIKIFTTTNPYTAALEIGANTDLDVTVNKHVEEKYAKVRVGGSGYIYHLVARGHRVTLNKHLEKGGLKTVDGKDPGEEEIRDSRVYGGQPEPGQLYDPEKPIMPPPPVQESGNFFWLFDNASQMNEFIKAWPKWYWVSEVSDGQFRAMHFDEPGMQKVADRARKQDDPGFTSLYINGEAKDKWLIYDMFYTSKASAGSGGGAGSTYECLVFSHGDHSYGRVALDHKEALAEWKSLDKAAIGDLRTKKIGEYPFEALDVKGSTGEIYEIDVAYLEARDILFDAVEKKRLGADIDWEDIVTPQVWADYVRKAIDRPFDGDSMDLHVLLTENEGLENEVGESLLRAVEWDARMQALFAISGAKQGLDIYATDEGAQRLVQKMIFMKWTELYQTVQFIGVPLDQQIHWVATFLDQAKGTQIWMGDEIEGVSTAKVKELIANQVADMEKFISAIGSNDIQPLYMEGAFGNEIRRIVYTNRSFDLAPEDFPHKSNTHPPLATDIKGLVGSEAGWIFARAAANDARHKERAKYFKVFLLVVASVALVMIAGAAGAFLAGVAFGTTATAFGAVAFTVTEIAISAGIVTLASPGMQTFIMSGGSATAEDYKKAYSHLGKDYLTNVITFGFFKALGAATRALSVAGAGGKEAFEASKAWQAADVGMRVVTSGGAMIGIGVLNQYIETGKMPDGVQMKELLFETALSVVLLEVGSYAAKGPLKSLQELARNIHLGEFAPQINDMLVRAHTMRGRIAELSTRPNTIGESGPKLVEDQIQLLADQKDLVAKMSKQSLRFGGDAKQLDSDFNKIIGDFDLLINQLKDIDFFRKTNIQPVGRETAEEAVFTYERGREKDIMDYYGKDNVKEVEGGLEVTQGKRKLIFRISTDLDPSLLPDGTREPQALQSWRSSLIKRKMLLLGKAFETAEMNGDLQKIEAADPTAMTDKDLQKFEKLLDTAEADLAKTSGNKPPVDTKNTGRQPGETADQWRLRLDEIKNNIRDRAKLIGFEYPFENLTTGRENLKIDTLQRYADILATEGKAVDAQWSTRFEAEKARQGIEPERSLDELKSGLKQRQQELARRADIFGTEGKDYMKRATKPSKAADEIGDLRQTEAQIEKAEAILDRAASAALKKANAKFGKATIDAARQGEFAGLSDQQVGDVMRLLQKAEGLSAEAIKGAFYASLGPPSKSTAKSVVPLEKAVRFAGSNAELNFVLESYLAINEAGIEGSYQIMRDATSSPGKWKGAVWQLEVIRFEVGTAKVKGVEIKAPGREIDILTHDGERIECKDWEKGTWDDDKVEKQFTRDLNAATDGGTNPKGMKDIIWMFRDPPPRSISAIRSKMRGMLKDFIANKLESGALNDAQAKSLLDAFDSHSSLVRSPRIDAMHAGAPAQPAIRPPLPPPLKRDDNDDK